MVPRHCRKVGPRSVSEMETTRCTTPHKFRFRRIESKSVRWHPLLNWFNTVYHLWFEITIVCEWTIFMYLRFICVTVVFQSNWTYESTNGCWRIEWGPVRSPVTLHMWQHVLLTTHLVDKHEVACWLTIVLYIYYIYIYIERELTLVVGACRF